MKKLFLLLLLVIPLFCACEGPEGLPGEPGESVNWKILNFTVKANDWELVGKPDALGSYYIKEFKVSSLTDFIYEEGNVQGYIFLNLDDNYEVQTSLPYIEYYGEGDGTSEKLWTESYSYDFTPGSIAFYVRYNDFYTGTKPPTCSFRVVMTW